MRGGWMFGSESLRWRRRIERRRLGERSALWARTVRAEGSVARRARALGVSVVFASGFGSTSVYGDLGESGVTHLETWRFDIRNSEILPGYLSGRNVTALAWSLKCTLCQRSSAILSLRHNCADLEFWAPTTSMLCDESEIFLPQKCL